MMKNESLNSQKEEPVVIVDECGDTLWDAVLEQEVKACQISEPVSVLDSLGNQQEREQVSEDIVSK